MAKEFRGDAWYSCAHNSGRELVLRTTDPGSALATLTPIQLRSVDHVHHEL